jgi:hypothetical protein
MLYLWLIHYSLLKGLYKKRYRGVRDNVDALTIICSGIFLIFLFVFAWDKKLLLSIFGNYCPLELIRVILFILFVLSILLLAFTSSGGLTEKNIKTIREIIILKKKIKTIYSWIYVFFFLALFIITLIFGEKPRF